MINFTNILLTIGAFALISCVATAVKAYRRNSSKHAAPFFHYFDPEYDRNLFPLDSWNDDENPYHLQTLAIEREIRDSSGAEQRPNGKDTTWRV